MGMVAIKETTLYWGILFPKNLNLKFLRGCNFDVLRNLDPTKKLWPQKYEQTKQD